MSIKKTFIKAKPHCFVIRATQLPGAKVVSFPARARFRGRKYFSLRRQLRHAQRLHRLHLEPQVFYLGSITDCPPALDTDVDKRIKSAGTLKEITTNSGVGDSMGERGKCKAQLELGLIPARVHYPRVRPRKIFIIPTPPLQRIMIGP